jgi:hypothetical protein
VFTARCVLALYIEQITFVLKGSSTLSFSLVSSFANFGIRFHASTFLMRETGKTSVTSPLRGP